jgi:hypothetical protein
MKLIHYYRHRKQTEKKSHDCHRDC